MTREETVKLTVKSLLEVVQTGAKNIEITVMDGYGRFTVSDLRLTSNLKLNAFQEHGPFSD